MKVKTTLQRILSKEFYPTLRKVMEKWPEARDIHALVKIAEAVENESRAFQKAQDTWRNANGYPLKNGKRSTNGEEITDHLLQEHGKFDASSKLSMAGSSDEDKGGFLKKKLAADAILDKFGATFTELLEKDFEFEIPRTIKVIEKYIRKGIISGHDCYVLQPILDLSGVSDLTEQPPESEDDEEV